MALSLVIDDASLQPALIDLLKLKHQQLLVTNDARLRPTPIE